MRLTHEQTKALCGIVHDLAGDEAEIRVFGSRLDDSRRGGDLDILIITAQPLPRLTLAELKYALEQALYLPVDILNYAQGHPPRPSKPSPCHRPSLWMMPHEYRSACRATSAPGQAAGGHPAQCLVPP